MVVTMLSGTTTAPAVPGTHATATVAALAPILDLPALSGSRTTRVESHGAEDLRALVGERLYAADFFTSGAHLDYPSLVVDDAGRTAVTGPADRLNRQVTRAP
ncbi:hypothetical protein G6038_30545 [Rhodococcus sp. 14C212]|uniref:hypothetical protein n=1 Tax=Rhodococcus sp. 14C212 TaxID=2711209 RepID=UPI0013EE1EDA|nr:hypothetical protein [Rhodococcus sp. 14C212]NGP09722.1 hypothetical protein [Rhodococcus sp. 14C212]